MGMSMPKDDAEADVMVEMNTTPLIDVMLVLLIMLIITIPIQTHAVKLNMPTSTSASNNEPPKVVEIAIDANGAITWDGEAVFNRADLEAKITQVAAMQPQPEIHLRPNKVAKYETVAMVMASSQRLGLTKFGLTGSEQFAEAY